MKYPTFFSKIDTLPFILVALLLLLAQTTWSKATRFRCMWRGSSATSMVVGWDQASGQDPLLLYDTVDHGKNVTAYSFKQTPDRISDFKGMNSHYVRLKDLTPNTIYYFLIVDSDGMSRRYSFQTLPDNQDARLSIVAGGDSRNHRDARRAANLMVSKLRPHFIMFGGDMTGKDTDKEWIDWLDDWQETITKDGRITPVVVARGNHEYSNRTLTELFDVVHIDLYYKMSFAGDLLQVYTLNSLMATGGDQKNWLEQKLRANSQAIWKFGQYHYTIRPHTKTKAERNDQYANWAKLFHQYGVDLVVESDAHVVKSTYPIRPSTEDGSDEGFIRDDKTGTVYVGEGCWGAPLRRNDDTKSWTRDSGSFNQFKWIFVDKSGIEVRTIKTDNAAQVSSVSDYDIFSPPGGINIWQAPNGSVIRIENKDLMVREEPTVVASTAPTTTSQAIEDSEPVFEEPITEGKAPVVARGKMKIVDFKASMRENMINVTWTTENELEGITFEIQRSMDGKNYETIETVIGEPITGQQTSYLINDRIDKENVKNGLSYRLRRMLPNGNSKVFAPCMVGADLKDWQMYARVTPDATQRVNVKYLLERDGDVSIRLLNVKKREILNTILKSQKAGNYQRSVDMKGIPKGTYILIVKQGRHIVRKYRVVNM